MLLLEAILLMCLRNCKRFQIYMVVCSLATAGNESGIMLF